MNRAIDAPENVRKSVLVAQILGGLLAAYAALWLVWLAVYAALWLVWGEKSPLPAPSPTVTLIGDSHAALLPAVTGWQNKARAGQTVSQLLPVMRAQLDHAAPIVILSVGANDLAAGRAVWLVEQETQIAADMIFLSGRRVVVTEIPVPRTPERLPDAVSDANYQRFVWVNQRGYTFCATTPELHGLRGEIDVTATRDGTHYDTQAQVVWQRQLADCVRQAEGKP